MRVFYAAKPAEFEAALVEKGVSFEHPDDDRVQFRVADNDVDVVEKIARRLTIYVYLKDDYVTNAAALGDRYNDSANSSMNDPLAIVPIRDNRREAICGGCDSNARTPTRIGPEPIAFDLAWQPPRLRRPTV